MQTDEKLIHSAIDNKALKSLAFYHLAKKHFPNSHIFSIAEAARRCNVDARVVRKHFNNLERAGLAYRVKDGFHLLSIAKAKLLANPKCSRALGGVHHLCTIKITERDTLNDVAEMLRAKIIEQKVRQVNYAKQPINPKRQKKCVGSIELTDNRAAEILNVSRATLTKSKRFWIARDILSIRTQRPKMIRRFINNGRMETERLERNLFLVHFKSGDSFVFQSFPTEYREYNIGERRG